MSTALVWFNKNLRTTDNSPLYEACKNCEKVIGIYFFDPRDYRETKFGFKKTGKFRAKFLLESVAELQQNLKNLHISLLIYSEKPEEIFENLISKHNINQVYLQKEWTAEEARIIYLVKKSVPEIEFYQYYDQFLYHPEDIPYSNFYEIPRVFTEFRKKLEASIIPRKCHPNPKKLSEENLEISGPQTLVNLSDLGFSEFEIDARTAFPFKGGEDQAQKRMQNYFWETGNLENYKQTRNGLIGENYSSKFSAWLANGSISAKQIYWEVKKFENEKIKNEDTYWLIFELLWRDFFKYISLKHGNKIFRIEGILDKNLDWEQDNDTLENWINGETKEAFINANMKELAATGFMSNRGRQNVASYWAKQLKQDWRIGAAYFESLLIDYDVHSNWGNWMYNSGVGNDPRDRKFNIKLQAAHYDPENKYQNLWLKD